jgi:hypothetical protein
MQHAPDLADLMRRWYEAFAAGDSAFLEGAFSHQEGVLAIGTDPQEWWTGYDTIVRTLRAQMQELGGMRFAPGEVVAYREGTVGWAVDRPSIQLPDGAEIPVRISAVYHQEDAAWKLVHWHVSIGVPNEEAVGQELTV